MFFITPNVFQGPFDSFFKWMPAHIAIIFHTDITGKIEAGISMDK